MTVPEPVRDRLGDEEPRSRVSLGGEDELLVTPTRTLLYRGEGLLSNESVEEHPHGAERIVVSEGRRKTTVTLDYGIDGESEFTVPTKRADEALRPVIGGVLRAGGIIEPDESVEQVYRLGELTIVLTEARVIKHIGNAVWDQEFEEYAFESVTGLEIERGDVSSQIIVEVEGRPQRIKAPSDVARELREHVERALLDYHGVGSYEEFLERVAPDGTEGDVLEEPEPTDDAEGREGSGGADDPAEGPADADDSGIVFADRDTLEVEASDPADAPANGDVAGEVAALREAVERQNELLERHQRTIEQLIEELRRGR